ncbi:MAG TPA: chemotaxis protein CheW [Falsiroseomonas sp.]|jgi:purine-binding chemotaxis protein CheW|nr:chemotaxis protein CheW [Falsiroseomonas sp.]
MTQPTGPEPGEGEARTRRILDARTAALARRGAEEASAAPLAQVLACAVRGEVYGIAPEAVARVRPAKAANPVPGATAPILGAVGLAGRICTLVDLGGALGLGMPAGEAAAGHLLELRRATPNLALRVDRALGIVPVFALAPGREQAAELARRGVTGYALAPAGTITTQETLLGLLDLDALLAPVLSPSSAIGA